MRNPDAQMLKQLHNSVTRYEQRSTPKDKRKVQDNILELAAHVKRQIKDDSPQAAHTEKTFLDYLKQAGNVLLDIAPAAIPILMSLL